LEELGHATGLEVVSEGPINIVAFCGISQQGFISMFVLALSRRFFYSKCIASFVIDSKYSQQVKF
jgi:hypothetical protein